MATVVALLVLTSASVLAIPEQGKWTVTLDEEHQYAAVAKHMYKDSMVTVTVSLSCDGDSPSEMEISWLLRMSPCAMEFVTATEEVNSNKHQDAIERYMQSPITYYDLPYDKVELVKGSDNHSCSEGDFKLEGNPDQKPDTIHIPKNMTAAATPSPASGAEVAGAGAGTPEANPAPPAPAGNPPPASAGSRPATAGVGTAAPNSRKKRDASSASLVSPSPGGGDAQAQHKSATAAPEAQPATTLKSVRAPDPGKMDHPLVAKAWVDGNYLFILKFKPKTAGVKFTAEVTIRMFYGDYNFISALDYPLLIFYGIMGLVYIIYGLIWLVLLACNWRDLLRVQFWIGGVILLGMLEKAVFFAEYENINKTGASVHGAVIFAELVSCMKRTLARMLVIIVSLGFGIVKPRLGQAFHKVLFVGGLFFILAAIEGSMRATSSKVDQSNQFLLAAVPLAVLDAIICWWIFSSLIQTTRTLRLRRNVVKLTLYRHFTNTLIFAVLASVAYMIWFMTQHKFKECIKDWKQLWVDEAFWHMLFVVLLLIIMLLWRPTANNQRYAFSPLLDAADEEDEEDAMMNDAFDGMKMRGVKAANGSPKQRDPKSKVEDDLRWVEENIPSSVADKALPTLLDSDEELMTTKFEMSKME